MQEKQGKAIKILWTGGWDSTFRLLQLLLDEHVLVQPVYLINRGRRSTDKEIQVMKKIRKKLFKDFPFTANLLLPTEFVKFKEIKPDAKINRAFKSILEKKFFGEQYEWLARYCQQNKIDNIELCIHRDDKAHQIIAEMVKKQPFGNWRVNPGKDWQETDEYQLFKYFSLPILDISKKQMQKIAKQKGWTEIMDMTWFCHTPKAGDTPCGRCNPCLYAIEEGMGWRIPWRIRALNKIKKYLNKSAINLDKNRKI
jgi:tRNA(Ile)-lysidine synthase TilS/MesJ